MLITTRKLEATARRGDVIDYTRFRLGRQIVRCPRCGARGRLNRIKRPRGTAHATITHRLVDIGWARVPPSDREPPPVPSPTPDTCFLDARALAIVEGT